MIITCTFDTDTHKVVPIVANELMLNYGYYYTESALPVYSDMVKAAPPYPANNLACLNCGGVLIAAPKRE